MKVAACVLVFLFASSSCLGATVSGTVSGSAGLDLTSVLGQIQNLVQSLPTLFQQVVTQIQTFVGSLLSNLQKVIPGLSLPSIPELGTIVNSISGWLSKLVTFVQNTVTGLLSPLTGISINLPPFPTSPNLINIIDYIVALVKAIVELVQQLLLKILGLFSAFPAFPDLGGLFGSVFNQISLWLGGLPGLLKAVVDQLFDGTLQPLLSNVEGVLNTLLSGLLPGLVPTGISIPTLPNIQIPTLLPTIPGIPLFG